MTDIKFDWVRKRCLRQLRLEPGPRRIVETVLRDASHDDPYYAYLMQVLTEAEAPTANN
ncbi:MAG: hypothetical protein HY243_15840 [Proteobacteria bacterium]|nr:hypothetical protein [Pseudomonadota bacterium]